MTDRFAGHPRLGGHDPAAGSDTGGVGWQGREVSASAFADDDGAADASVLAALSELSDSASSDAERRLLLALTGQRVLVPVVAVADEVDTSGSHTVEASTAMATVTLTAPDGTTALPVFTSVEALTRWDPKARPVPLHVVDAARGALDQGCGVVILDLGEPTSYVLRSSMLWALAGPREWVPPYADPHVRAAVAAAAAELSPAVGLSLLDGSGQAPGLTVLEVAVSADVAPDLQSIVDRVAAAIEADPEARARLDDLTVSVRTDPPR